MVLRLYSVTYPGEADTVYGVRQHVPQHGGPRRQARIVGVHVGTLPMNHLRNSRRRKFTQAF